MKVLYIGGTGNISTASSCRAVEQGIELWHLNRGRAPSGVHGVKTINCDINNTEKVAEALRGHEWDCVVNWIAFTPADVQRDIELFAGKTRQYIFISSASCYDLPQSSPVITEETPLGNPYWQYSRDKIAAENLLVQTWRKQHFPITIVRPSHTYSTVIPVTLGGWQEFNVVARMRAGKPTVVQGDGTSLWVLTHAEDFAVGFNGLIGKEAAIGEAFHITSDELLTWNQIYTQLGAAAGVDPDLVHVASDTICALAPDEVGSLLGDKAHSVIFDNSKIRSVVPEFQPTISFAEGIRTTLEWFEADPARQVINPETDALLDKLSDIALQHGRPGKG